MTPRKMTQHGAKTTARRTPKAGARRASSSAPKKPAAKKRTTSSRPFGRLWMVPIAAIVVTLLLGWTYYPVARVQYLETRRRAGLEAQLESLKARNDRLRRQVARLKTPEGVEDLARTQLGLVKQGEHVVVVVDETPTVEATKSAGPHIDDDPIEAVAPRGPWTAFLDTVFRVEQ